MPWNQPGSGNNNSDRDPWGQKKGGGNQPPDLDEIARKLQQRLSGLFGGGGGGGGNGASSASGGGPTLSKAGIFAVLGGLLGIWFLTGFYTVQERERAVVLRFGEYRTTKDSGLNWYPRFIDTVEKVDTQKLRSVEVGYRGGSRDRRTGSSMTKPDEALMLTKDENIIGIQLAVQYDIKDPAMLLFNVKEAPEDVDRIVRQATESAIREIVGNTIMDTAITEGRSELGAKTETLLQKILDDHQTGVNIRSVEMQGALPPPEVKDAFDDAVRAREDEERLKNEAEAYANDVVPRARGEAASIRQQAEGYKAAVVARSTGEADRFVRVLEAYRTAPGVTRDRLYIESMEQVLGNSSKLVIDQKGGGNNVMYLPLDQMIREQRNNAVEVNTNPRTPTSSGTTGAGASATNTRGGRTQGRSLSRN